MTDYLPGLQPLDQMEAGAEPKAIGTGVTPQAAPEQGTSFFTAVGAARELYGTSNWLGRYAQQSAIPADPNYRLSSNYDELVKDVPESFVPALNDELSKARSSEESWSIRNQYMQELHLQDEISKQGWKGIAATFAVGLFDEGNLALGFYGPIATVGRITKLANAMSKLSKAQRLAAYGALGAAENAALEAGAVGASKTRHPIDVAYAAAFGGLFGAAAGHFHKPLPSGSRVSPEFHMPEPDLGAPAAKTMERADSYIDEAVTTGNDRVDVGDPVTNQADADVFTQNVLGEDFIGPQPQREQPTEAAPPIMQADNLKFSKASAQLDIEERGLQAQLDSISAKLAKEPDAPPPKPTILDEIAKAREVATRAKERFTADPKTRTLLDQELNKSKRALLATIRREAPDAFAEADLKLGMPNKDYEAFLQKKVDAFAKKAEAEHAKASKEYEDRIAALERDKEATHAKLDKLSGKRTKLEEKYAAKRVAPEAVAPEPKSIGAAAATPQARSQSTLTADAESIIGEEAPATAGEKARQFNSANAYLRADENKAVQHAGRILTTNHTGSHDGSVSTTGAATLNQQYGHEIGLPWEQQYTSARKDWIAEQGRMMPGLPRASLERDFGELVSDAIEGVGNASANPHVAKAAKAQSEMYRKTFEKGRDAELVGFDEFNHRDTYTPHIHDQNAFGVIHGDYELPANVAANRPTGWGADDELIYQALRRASPNVDPATLRAATTKYTDIVHHKSAGVKGSYLDMERFGEKDYIRSSLEAYGVDEATIDEIENLFGFLKSEKQGDRIGRAKSRATLDMNTKVKLMKEDPATGNMVEVEVPVTALFVRDAALLGKTYMRSILGRAAIADASKGSAWHLTSDKAFNDMMRDIQSWENTNGVGGRTSWRKTIFESKMKTLENIRNSMIGIPVNDHTFWHNTLRSIMRYNFITRMGQMGFAATAEFGNVMAQVGLRRMITQIPEVARMFSRDANGQFNHPLMRLAEQEFGVNSAIINGKHHADHIDDPEFTAAGSRFLEGARDVMRGLENTVSAPLRGVMMIQERQLLLGVWREIGDIAKGRAKLTDSMIHDWASYGLSEPEVRKVYELIGKHGDYDGKSLNHPRHDLWGRENRDLWLKFKSGMFRMTRRIVQENDLSNLPAIMPHTAAKVALQFRTFQIGAIDKSLGFNINRLRNKPTDIKAWTELSYQMLWSAAGLYAMIQTKAIGMDKSERRDYLKTMLDPQRFAAMTFARTGYSTLIPGAIDTAMNLGGYESVFSQSRSSGLHQNLVTGNPTVSLAMGAMRAVKGTTESLVNPEKRFDAKDLAAWQHILPLNNFPGMFNLWNAAPDLFDLPDSDK